MIHLYNVLRVHYFFCLFFCVQVTLSGRDVDVGISVRTSGAVIDAIPCNEAEGSVFALVHKVLPKI